MLFLLLLHAVVNNNLKYTAKKKNEEKEIRLLILLIADDATGHKLCVQLKLNDTNYRTRFTGEKRAEQDKGVKRTSETMLIQ